MENTAAKPKKEVKKSKPSPPAKSVAYYGTGRRKEAAARVWIMPGKTDFQVNGRKLEEYFPVETLVSIILQPLIAANQKGQVGVRARVSGGGISGQAGAVRHGIARALVRLNSELKRTLREGGYLTRDPRMKERKKFGRKGARKSFQYSKR